MTNSARWIVGSALLLAAGASIMMFSPTKHPPASPMPDASPKPAAVVTAKLAQDRWHPWPPQPEVVGVPRPGSPAAAAPPLEPAAPTPAEIKKESLRTLTSDEARTILLDPKKSSTLKLSVMEKLRGQPPEKVVPVLVAFLQAPASAPQLKPSAVKLLADLRHPSADAALADLSAGPDERVRVTIATLRAKESTR